MSSEVLQHYIGIKELIVKSKIGLNSDERQQPQTLVISLEGSCDFTLAAQEDDIQLTIDYAKVTKTIRDACARHSFKLLESLANALLVELLERYAFYELSLEIIKPQAISNCTGAYVKLLWNKS